MFDSASFVSHPVLIFSLLLPLISFFPTQISIQQINCSPGKRPHNFLFCLQIAHSSLHTTLPGLLPHPSHNVLFPGGHAHDCIGSLLDIDVLWGFFFCCVIWVFFPLKPSHISTGTNSAPPQMISYNSCHLKPHQYYFPSWPHGRKLCPAPKLLQTKFINEIWET